MDAFGFSATAFDGRSGPMEGVGGSGGGSGPMEAMMDWGGGSGPMLGGGEGPIAGPIDGGGDGPIVDDPAGVCNLRFFVGDCCDPFILFVSFAVPSPLFPDR